jgi:3-deoxy-D-manno-octulosonic acid kinase
MTPRQKKSESGVIIYDADAFADAHEMPAESWFRPGHWQRQGLVTAEHSGRGTALTVNTPVGSCVLRKYLRGGMVAKLVRSRYLFFGYQNSRPFSEFRVLARCAELGLPSPRPVAAICERHFLSTSGAIMTREIENIQRVEQAAETMGESEWRAVGEAVRQFHDHGLVHADLNVRNILLQDSGKVFLVDFDRAYFRPGADSAFRSNLKRLHRSIVKSDSEEKKGFNEQAWMQLLNGYG